MSKMTTHTFKELMGSRWEKKTKKNSQVIQCISANKIEDYLKQWLKYK